MATNGMRPLTVAEAFAETAKALQQFSIERVRIEGLSSNEEGAEEQIKTMSESDFMREFVFHSRPCIIVGALHDWPAMHRWRDDGYLFDLDGKLPMVYPCEEKCDDDRCGSESSGECDTENAGDGLGDESVEVHAGNDDAPEPVKTLGPRRVTVALTPNGRADAVTYVTYRSKGDEDKNQGDGNGPVVTEKLFMSAAEVRVTLPELYRLLRANPPFPPLKSQFVDLRRPHSVIAYAQMQNNCLNKEYDHLHDDISTALDQFGARVFGGPHEAANIWLGTPASVSSMHQDWVENLYAVVRGVKEFILVPPWEGVFVPKPEIPAAAFSISCTEEKVTGSHHSPGGVRYAFNDVPVRDGTSVGWMDVEITPAAVEDPQYMKEDLRDKLHPLIAYVQPGEVLYLPALWLHRVAQHADAKDSDAISGPLIEKNHSNGLQGERSKPLPLIAAVNYWYDMSFVNPAVVMLREFGLLL
uniref:WGS project CAEQ00000000 data, annotated contig 1960 n=1 Tax=Trypanosoma congolense (strain IL3000) TaxID=1068625 RepID=F9WAE0_TRYCI|nr:unnamed protein product [Trypanosoma congolense IL3000]